MKPVFCCNCENYGKVDLWNINIWIKYGLPLDWCNSEKNIITRISYQSSNRVCNKKPAKLNEHNDCKMFTKKEEKKIKWPWIK